MTADPFRDCLLLADDFTQYYLGAYSRTPVGGRRRHRARVDRSTGRQAPFGGPATVDNPVDEAGAFVTTSDVLPVEEFPQFASRGVADYADPRAVHRDRGRRGRSRAARRRQLHATRPDVRPHAR